MSPLNTNLPYRVFVDMDGVLCDFEKGHARYSRMFPSVDYPQSIHGFWRDLDPIPGALVGMETLLSMRHLDVYIATAPSYKNPICYSEKREWIENHFSLGLCKKLILTKQKHFLWGDFLVDDCESGAGQDRFCANFIHFGSKSYPNWISVVNFFERLK